MNIEQVQAARVNALQAGDAEAVAEFDEMLAELAPAEASAPSAPAENKVGIPEGLFRSFSEGVTHGAMGEIQGALPGGSQQVTDQRRQAFAKEHPVLDFAADVAGSGVIENLLVPGGGGIPGGIGFGALQGAMRSEPGNRELGALAGGVAGGALSWLGPKLMGGISDAVLKRIPKGWTQKVDDAISGKLGKKTQIGTARAYQRGEELADARIEGMLRGRGEAAPRLFPNPESVAKEVADMSPTQRHAFRVGMVKKLGDRLDEGDFNSIPKDTLDDFLEEMNPVLQGAFEGSKKGGDVINALKQKIRMFDAEPSRRTFELGKVGTASLGRIRASAPRDIRWPRVPMSPPGAQAAPTHAVQQAMGLASSVLGGRMAPPFTGLLGDKK